VCHINVEEEYHVGCICAGKMTDDYNTCKLEEDALKKLSAQQTRFLERTWHVTKNGNRSLVYETFKLLIFKTKNGKYQCKVNDTFGKKEFETLEEAKLATWNGIQYFKNKEK